MEVDASTSRIEVNIDAGEAEQYIGRERFQKLQQDQILKSPTVMFRATPKEVRTPMLTKDLSPLHEHQFDYDVARTPTASHQTLESMKTIIKF